jgi:hypothetical protein
MIGTLARASFQDPILLPGQIIDLAMGFFMMVTVIALGVPIIRAVSRRWDRGASTMPSLPADLTNRLERIEQAVEAVAIEVERMAEAQRFTARLMAEQKSLSPGEPPGSSATAMPSEPLRRPDSR